MAASSARRPIPALIFLLLLSLLTGLVWWRVLHRPDAAHPVPRAAGPSSCTPSRAWPKQSTVTVTVLNASNRTGLAHDVAGQLKGRGFTIGGIGNDPTTGSRTQVRYAPSSATAARLVLTYLPGAKLVPVTGTSKTVTVAVGSSYKRLATATQVKKAQRTLPPATC